MKAIREAIAVKRNTKHDIAEATKELLSSIIKENKLEVDKIIGILFSATSDLTKIFPAKAAREMGLTEVPLFCSQEMKVEGSMKRVIGVLMMVETDAPVRHQYLGEAQRLLNTVNNVRVKVDGNQGVKGLKYMKESLVKELVELSEKKI